MTFQTYFRFASEFFWMFVFIAPSFLASVILLIIGYWLRKKLIYYRFPIVSLACSIFVLYAMSTTRDPFLFIALPLITPIIGVVLIGIGYVLTFVKGQNLVSDVPVQDVAYQHSLRSFVGLICLLVLIICLIAAMGRTIPRVCDRVVSSKEVPVEDLRFLYNKSKNSKNKMSESILSGLTRNSNTPIDILEELTKDPSLLISDYAESNLKRRRVA